MKKLANLLQVILLIASVFVGLIQPLRVQAQDKKRVAIIQLVSHPSLDDIVEGIYEGMEAAGYKKDENVEYDYQNAEGDLNLLGTIVEQVISNQPDVIVAVTTPVAQACQNATTEIPIVMSGVTDPLAAKLVDSMEAPGGNITGVSDKIAMDVQFELIKQVAPDVKKIGMIYTTSEDNSQNEIEEAKAAAEAQGYEVKVEGIASALDMQLVVENLAKQVDAIFTGSDNTIANAYETVLDITDQVGIPAFPTVDNMVAQGGLSAVAINQKQIGIVTAPVIDEILKGANPAELAVRFVEPLNKIVNLETADRLGIQIADDVLKELKDVSKHD